jgi:hypothetical protein
MTTRRTGPKKPENRQSVDGRKNNKLTPEMEAKKFQPGVSGNPGGRPAKIFSAALLRIVEKKIAHDPDGRALLDGIAQQLVAKATKGDLASIRELADRIEGTPARSITLGGEGGGAIPFVNVSPAENERRITELLAKTTTITGEDQCSRRAEKAEGRGEGSKQSPLYPTRGVPPKGI